VCHIVRRMVPPALRLRISCCIDHDAGRWRGEADQLIEVDGTMNAWQQITAVRQTDRHYIPMRNGTELKRSGLHGGSCDRMETTQASRPGLYRPELKRGTQHSTGGKHMRQRYTCVPAAMLNWLVLPCDAKMASWTGSRKWLAPLLIIAPYKAL
jgi:hypothetical protein